ncbi:methyltransferase family protein [Blastopirellula marina]|uniref:Uncharacterized protein n=1 Tax=Blastopirellula marina TaxID=124 RepID=A0A2S8GR34_9BACT|nr:hypothetical protein [Blastopirellula marina]PQO46831.1 hypothetical protein C5Y93_06690 [Blastopirellula marina]
MTGVLVGLITQSFFAYTAICLFFFLKDGGSPEKPFRPILNVLLTLQFAIPHSLLLWPPASRALQRWIPKAFYGSFYCVVTCLSLVLLFRFWTTSAYAVWDLTGTSAAIVQWLFLLSWGALIYSLSLTGLGYQTGLTQWWAWLRNISLPRRGVPTAGAYHWLRHPVYLSFMGLIWFTPRMTLDHVVLTAVWTAYLVVGSYLKDERLAFYLGESYRSYQRSVPGFSLFGSRLLGSRESGAEPAESPAAWPLKLESSAAAPVEKAA